MDNRASTQLSDLVSKNKSVGIAVGKNPGVDEMAAALALFIVLKSQGKDVSIVCPTSPLVEHSRLVGIDRVKESFELSGGDMTVSFPYQEGEIDKISYTLEDGLLNIVVKAGEEGLSFNEKDVMFKRSQGYPSLLFVVGTSRLSDLDRIYDPEALKDTTVVNIDNKPDNQGYGDVSIVSPTSSSISEKIADLMLSMGFNIDIDTAQNLLIGIENATENFQNSKTTPLAFEITGELIRKGAIRGSANIAKPKLEDYSSDEDLESVFGSSSFPQRPQQLNQPMRQPIRQQMRQPLGQQVRQPLGQRIVRQPNAGQTLQSLQNKQIDQDQDSSGQDLNIERKDTKISERTDKKPPVDWLTPKIYKGSTNI